MQARAQDAGEEGCGNQGVRERAPVEDSVSGRRDREVEVVLGDRRRDDCKRGRPGPEQRLERATARCRGAAPPVDDDRDGGHGEDDPERREDVVHGRSNLADRVSGDGEEVDRRHEHALSPRTRDAVREDHDLMGKQCQEEVLRELAQARRRGESERVEVAPEPNDPGEGHQ